MTRRTVATLDANEAVARVAYKLNEAIAIDPIARLMKYGLLWSGRRSTAQLNRLLP